MKYPRSFSHIGLSVPDLEKAVAFYRDVMGWYSVMKPSTVKEEVDTAIGIMCQDVFNHITTGMFHFSVQDPDIEGLVQAIVDNGGKQRMPIREYYPGEKPYKMCYVEDPFGIVFEVYSHSYEVTYSSGAY